MNRCGNCKYQEEYGGGDYYCNKKGFGLRAEMYDCECFIDRNKNECVKENEKPKAKNESIEVTYQINIPNDATNGDVIKAMFPNIQMIEVFPMVHLFINNIMVARIDIHMLNAKYER